MKKTIILVAILLSLLTILVADNLMHPPKGYQEEGPAYYHPEEDSLQPVEGGQIPDSIKH